MTERRHFCLLFFRCNVQYAGNYKWLDTMDLEPQDEPCCQLLVQVSPVCGQVRPKLNLQLRFADNSGPMHISIATTRSSSFGFYSFTDLLLWLTTVTLTVVTTRMNTFQLQQQRLCGELTWYPARLLSPGFCFKV